MLTGVVEVGGDVGDERAVGVGRAVYEHADKAGQQRGELFALEGAELGQHAIKINGDGRLLDGDRKT